MLTKLYRVFFIVFLLCQGMILGAKQLKIFISVDMEGIGGIGTSEMTRHGGKDYNVGRQLMTDEVNAVVKAIFKNGPSEILVNNWIQG